MRRMRRTATVVTALVGLAAVALLAGNQRGGNQPGQPNFDTGPLPVVVQNEPAVTIANQPVVLVTNEPVVGAQQLGEWTVRVLEEPSRQRIVALSDAQVASLTMPGFVQPGVTYTFVWSDGTRETHLVVAVAGPGWVQVEGEGGSLTWLNTAVARAIEAPESVQ